jgi:thioester reductase-like protein
MEDTVFLTGATGQLGLALIPHLLSDGNTRVVALVRASDDARLQERKDAMRAWLGEAVPWERLDVVPGDVARPQLGMDAATRERMESSVTSIVHAAASVRFDLTREQAARENIGGTGHVLELAATLQQKGRLGRLDHVSTAFVAGDFRGRFHEHQCDVGQGFRNSYEWSKMQAELAVRQRMAEGLPVAVHRPSIVVGDSRTGSTRAFNVLYWPLKVYTRGWWRTFPGRPDTSIDIVPVDFVAAAIARLRRNASTLGQCFHLAAGDGARTVRELADRIVTITGGPPVRYVDQNLYKRFARLFVYPFLSLSDRGRGLVRGGEAYMPYFAGNPLFDTSKASALLGSECRPPAILEYLDTIVGYAVARDFGGNGAPKIVPGQSTRDSGH